MDANIENTSQDTHITSVQKARCLKAITDPLTRQLQCFCSFMKDFRQESKKRNGETTNQRN